MRRKSCFAAWGHSPAAIDGFAKMPLQASIFVSWYNTKKSDMRLRISLFLINFYRIGCLICFQWLQGT